MSEQRSNASEESYKDILSIPIYTEACYLPLPEQDMFVVHASYKEHDLDEKEVRKRRVSFFGAKEDGNVRAKSSVTNECNHVEKTAYHRPSMKQAILRKSEKSGKSSQSIEIWSNQRRLHSFNISEMKLHGNIYQDGQFGSFCWNNQGDKLLYIAEKEYSEAAITGKALKGEDFEYSNDWGESLQNYRTSVICILDIGSGKVTFASPSECSDMTFGQATWISNDSIAYIGWQRHPFNTGIVYCYNRRSYLFIKKIDSENPTRISDEGYSVWSPRCSPDGKLLVYLRNTVGGPHNKCGSLMKYNIDDGTTETLVDVVHSVDKDGFPGIFVGALPSFCWTEDCRNIIFSTLWRSSLVAISVDIENGKISKLDTSQYCAGSYEVMDVYENLILVQVSAINVEPFLVLSKFGSSGKWSSLDLDAPRFIPTVSWSVRTVFPELINNDYPSLDYEVIVVTPDEKSKTDPKLIVWAHGGPHSLLSTQFARFAPCFALQGFCVCLVNYRGSVGFGENNINSLIGKIGVQDISDVHYAGQLVKQELLKRYDFADMDVFLFGGSHGGFINAHLSGQYPEYYKACCIRNPVINLVGMFEGTDIPDWIWSESGLGHFDQKMDESHNYFQDLWKASPVRYADSVTIPTLLLLGKNDRRVPPTQGLLWYRMLKSRNVPVKVFMYESGHPLDSTWASSESFLLTVKFFHEHSILNCISDA